MRTSIISPNGSANRARRGRMQLLAVVLFAFIALETTTVVSAEKVLRHPVASSSGRCAKGVKAYLLQTVKQRAEVTASETRARAELNEARTIVEEEKGGQREPKEDTQERVRAAWSNFESASAAAQKFDAAVLNSHGKLPLECILEVDALRGTDPNAESWFGQTIHALEKVALHLRLYGETLRGVVLFNLAEYESAVSSFYDFVEVFSAKSQQAYNEFQQRRNKVTFGVENGGLRELAELALMYTRFITLALVPWMTVFSVCVLLIIFAPFFLSAVLLPQLVWRVWVQLFFLHHTYGLTVDGLFNSLQQYFGLLTEKDWAGLQERFLTALLTLATAEGSLGTFYNGIIAATLIISTMAILLTFIYYWVKLPYSLMAREGGGGGKRHARNQSRKGAPQTSSSGGSTTATTTAGNAGPKDKSPAHVSEAARHSTRMSNRPTGDGGGNTGNSSEKNSKKKA
ncbi:hypothetical protein TCDM_08956 [Trypanosoma cruzi Dm28c]|uniref:Uncharacterized protein n=2 Tax=Trypanosoma cruzi TaxID=5693 RepID=V5BFM4_TRYCR|nr:hypothetical protein TCDM_08956 [Trypanosoma cruzi Dm28c]PBJ79646.1 hypothetical protein BCY84_02371 [Trypanosoma cruzi cruzi]PWU97238.1 hypothetical protein C4B63_16g319 [Trypanosoma cruzi]